MIKAVHEELESKNPEHKMGHELGFKVEGELVLVWCKDCVEDVYEYFRKIEVMHEYS